MARPKQPERLCSCDGCERPHHGRGYCAAHHQQWVRTGATRPIRVVRRVCSAEGCERPHRAKGLCYQCYMRRYNRTQAGAKRQIRRIRRIHGGCQNCGADAGKGNRLCDPCRAKETERRERKRAERREAGLCRYCGRAKRASRSVCERCRKQALRARSLQYRVRKSNDLCVTCGRAPARPGRTKCETCGEVAREKQIEYKRGKRVRPPRPAPAARGGPVSAEAEAEGE